jgi:hypothetical protein
MKSYSSFLETVNQKVKVKKPKVTEGEDKPEDYEFMGTDDEGLHEPSDTGI